MGFWVHAIASMPLTILILKMPLWIPYWNLTTGVVGGSIYIALQWRYNERDRVSNHQPHDCLLNRLFKRRSKKTSKLRTTSLCAGNSPITGEFPAQRAVTRKMFPFDDVIMRTAVVYSLWPSRPSSTLAQGNGLLSDSTEPLPEPMLTCHQSRSVAIISEQFHKSSGT